MREGCNTHRDASQQAARSGGERLCCSRARVGDVRSGRGRVRESRQAVEHAGYPTTLPPAGTAESGVTRAERDAGLEEFCRRLVVSALLAVMVVAHSLTRRPLQLDNWQWLAFQLVAPAVVWDAWSFRRAAFANARHRATTMDTLSSLRVPVPEAGSRERAIRWR